MFYKNKNIIFVETQIIKIYMKKIYSIIGLLALTITANAQGKSTRTAQAREITVSAINPQNSVVTPTTTALQPASFGATSGCTVTTYGAGADGYVAGTNAYGDVAKSQKYDLATYTLGLPATVNGVAMIIPYVTGTGSVTAKVYSDASGLPGTLLGTSVPVGLSTVNTATYTTFAFASAVNLTGTIFHVALDFSATNAATGDTVIVAQTDDGCTANTVGGANEQLSDNSWQSFTTPSPAGWGFTSTDLAIFPIVTAEMATGVKNLTSNLATISPNPSNGIFNISLKSNTDVNVTVTNAIGQTVVNKNFTSSESISVDLSNNNNGVYFVTITNGKEKSVKKVVLNK